MGRKGFEGGDEPWEFAQVGTGALLTVYNYPLLHRLLGFKSCYRWTLE